MSLALREENFVVINVGSSYTMAGIGMHDTNKPPSVIVNMEEYDYPIKENAIVDWTKLEECWHHILFKELNIKKSRNESPVLLAVPVQWSKLEHERITQIFFESFNVPGVYIAPQPLLSAFGCGSVTGLIVDVGSQMTDINVVVDSLVQSQSNFTIPIGGNHFDDYFLQLLKKDDQFVQHINTLPDITLDLALARFVREQPGVCVVSVGHNIEKAAATEPLSMMDDTLAGEDIIEDGLGGENVRNPDDEESSDIPERINVEYKGHTLSIGSYRHRVMDPLFMPEILDIESPSLPESMRLAAMNCEPPEIRPKIWESIIVTGGCSQTQALPKRIKTEVQLFLPHSENTGDTQPRILNFLRIPDYFTVLKDKKYQHFSTWLGAEIVAKLVFMDAKNYVSKVDYNESGPSVIHTKSY
ncbi:actin-like ATPase domain-containing protein [Backusella circina FSU 941]|nr:actin-like ATPase domain-containing protein [Backusella circina FSU 941]